MRFLLTTILLALVATTGAQERGTRNFVLSYKAVYHNLTPGAQAQMWAPLPQSSSVQKVSRLRMSPPMKAKIVTDPHGNRLLHMKGQVPKHGRLTFKFQTQIQRQVWENDSSSPVPLLDTLRRPGADEHLFLKQARAESIPARLKLGFLLSSDTEGVCESGLWACFQTSDKGWVPVDFSAHSLGSLDQNRVLMSTGQNLTFEPPQQSGPVEHFLHPLLEVEGQKVKPSEFAVSYSDRSSKVDK